VFLGACGRADVPGDPADRAAGWLWAQQAEDGGWHSRTYGLLKSGQALTPFVLHALLCHDPEADPAGVDRALSFLRSHVRPDGALGHANPVLLEYPNYATAFALRCLVKAGRERDMELVVKMRDYLVGQQYRDVSSPTFGGWGFGGRSPHMDLSHVRCVLQALREAGGVDPAVFVRAQAFLRLLQRRTEHPQTGAAPFDGGFYFSPVIIDANKGDGFSSYATATGDGLLSLLAAGVPEGDERVKAARAWLERHDDLERPAGIPDDRPIDWGPQVHYYHLCVRALAGYDVRAEVAKRQEASGRFVGIGHLMKEDDPLIATTLALRALTD
jgi:squalene-hopene/tetraprenyl-beta-curcumene cyclase